MLGEQIGEFQGKVIGQRVLPFEGPIPKMETTVEFSGPLVGIQSTTTVTYVTIPRADGSIYGQGQGVVMTAEGDMATFQAAGIGNFAQDGSIGFRGAIYYETAAPKLARLNGIAAIYEYDVAADGSVSGNIWEWK